MCTLTKTTKKCWEILKKLERRKEHLKLCPKSSQKTKRENQFWKVFKKFIKLRRFLVKKVLHQIRFKIKEERLYFQTCKKTSRKRNKVKQYQWIRFNPTFINCFFLISSKNSQTKNVLSYQKASNQHMRKNHCMIINGKENGILKKELYMMLCNNKANLDKLLLLALILFKFGVSCANNCGLNLSQKK